MLFGSPALQSKLTASASDFYSGDAALQQNLQSKPVLQRQIGVEGLNAQHEAADNALRLDAKNPATQGDCGQQITNSFLRLSSPMVQRTKMCSKRLQAPGLGLIFNHSYIDDTGMDNCKGSSMPGNYAVQDLVSGNFLKGCAVKTATSTDPQSYTPNVKQCDPAPGVTDLSKCLSDAYASYSDPSLYQNLPVENGPNSNTFAATLAKACCADSSSSGLGLVPGWDHDPAPPCPSGPAPAPGVFPPSPPPPQTADSGQTDESQ
jgi:hypothetical protein